MKDHLMIGWTPNDFVGGWKRYASTKGKVFVGPWPDHFGWSDNYALTEGACTVSWREAKNKDFLVLLLSLFNVMVVNDRLDPIEVDKAFRIFDVYKKFKGLEEGK